MELSIYPCTEQELYTIADLGWNSCLTYQVNFFAFKPKYTVLYIQGKLADIEAARILPDEQTRNKEYETAHIDLKILGTQSCDKWQDLKRYIADAFDKLHLKTNLDAAGQGYYYKATHENWESVKALLNNGSQFITDNLAALTANDNMPPAFQAEFDAVKLAFENKHKEFLKAEENSVLGQATKMKANNALFTDLSPMFADAQRVFTEPEIQKQFTFTELLYLASGAGTAGARGHATDTQTGSPIPNILVHTVGGTYHETTTDDSGFYEMLQLAAGETVIRFEGLPQYENKDITKTIIVGTVSTFDVELTPKPVGATGHVTDSITGLQLGNITVKTDDAHTTVSDADGLYQLLNLPLGDNIIHFIGLPSHGNKDINTTITVGTINTVDAQLNSLIP